LAPKILYFIQLPPPIHGVSSMNKLIFNSDLVNQGIEKELLEIRFSNKLNQLRRLNLRKLIQFFRLVLELSRRINKFRPDFIYFSIMPVGKGFWRDLLFVIVIKTYGIKTIYHLHNRGIARNSKRFLMRRLYQFVFKNSYIIHLSEGLMDREIKSIDIKGIKRFVVPNGVKNKDTEGTRETGIVNLLYLSNLFPQKGIFDLIEMYSELVLNHNKIHLNIVGGFPYSSTHKKVVKRIKELDLESRISLLGPKYGKHKSKEFLKAHLFIFPTSFKQECFPLVVLEAMNYGLPVVASIEGAIPEILEHGQDGFVISLENRSDFIKKIEDLILDPELRETIGNNARKKFLEKYTDEKAESMIREIFVEEILN